MTAPSLFQTLDTWCTLLEQIAAIELSIDLEPSVIEERLAERQKTIEQLQTLDADLVKIADHRREQWPSLSPSERPEAELRVQKGRALLQKIMLTDSATIQKAQELRTDLLDKLKNVSLGRGYDPSSRAPAYRPPVIVDKKA